MSTALRSQSTGAARGEAEALRLVFGRPAVPACALRPELIRAARELWRRDVSVPRIAALLRLSRAGVHELLLAADNRPPERGGENLSRRA